MSSSIRWRWAAALYAVTVTTCCAAIVVHTAYRFDGVQLSLARSFLWQGGVWFAWGVLGPSALWLGARLPLPRAAWWRRMPAFAALSVPVILLHVAIASGVEAIALPSTVGHGDFLDDLVSRGPLDLLVYWSIIGVGYAMEYFDRARHEERRAALLQESLVLARLDAMRRRLHPHFLFNTLNAIGVLIADDPAAAQRMLLALSSLLRAALEGGDRQEVTLAEEVGLVQLYLDIERIRFADRLGTAVACDESTMQALVPEFLLQPLVENAIHHGLWPGGVAGHLEIRAATRHASGRDSLVVHVIDDGVGMASGAVEHHGLSITRERLTALYGARAELAIAPRPGGGTEVRLELPLRFASSTAA